MQYYYTLLDSDHDSSDLENNSPDSSMILTQCIPQVIQHYDNNDNNNKELSETKEILKRSTETQCNILKRSVSTRDAEVQTNNETYAFHCSKRTAIYVEKLSESKDNVYVNIEIPNETIKPKRTIRLGLSKKWKLEYKVNK